jgi:hypothetical protein
MSSAGCVLFSEGLVWCVGPEQAPVLSPHPQPGVLLQGTAEKEETPGLSPPALRGLPWGADSSLASVTIRLGVTLTLEELRRQYQTLKIRLKIIRT